MYHVNGSCYKPIYLTNHEPIRKRTLTLSHLLPTPLIEHPEIARHFGLDIDLRVKRDDLFPMPGGGIKSRKIYFIMKDLLEKGHDMVVTNGGPQSNHARSAALLAAQMGIPCHLVIVLESEKKYPVTGNLLLMQLTGATIEYCRKDQLSAAMDEAIDRLKGKGFNPAYIWGGGHNNAGTRAFYEASIEAQSQCGGWIPDYFVLASGTGSTQAGFAIGYAGLRTKVVGISVARDKKRGTEIIEDCVQEYGRVSGKPNTKIEIIFKDEWTFGGYESASEELYFVIKQAAQKGFILDPTYSGKGFYGLIEMVKSGEIPKKSRVLFWHTGGLLNLMASDLAKGSVSLKH